MLTSKFQKVIKILSVSEGKAEVAELVDALDSGSSGE